jgi:hypothetical protein
VTAVQLTEIDYLPSNPAFTAIDFGDSSPARRMASLPGSVCRGRPVLHKLAGTTARRGRFEAGALHMLPEQVQSHLALLPLRIQSPHVHTNGTLTPVFCLPGASDLLQSPIEKKGTYKSCEEDGYSQSHTNGGIQTG